MMPNDTQSSVATLVVAAFKRQILNLQNYTLLVIESIAKVLTHPRYVVDTVEQMDVIGVGSLPIILLAGIFIGGVTVLQTAAQFERFGEKALTGDAVALALVRELGPVITALLVSGRNASGIASELGSMVVTEQVDAMRALGTDPIRKLIGPRIVATVLMLPLLVALFDFVGMVGGYVVAHFTLGLGVTEFWNRAIQSLEGGDLVQGISKPLVFGFILSTVGCYQGLKVRGGTQGVGRATTTAVVVSCVSVLIVDFFMSRVLLYIYKV